MKTLVVGLSFLLFGFAEAQITRGMCEERGHIMEYMTKWYDSLIPARVIDQDTISYYLKPRSGITEIFYCPRCGKEIAYPLMEVPDTTIVWRKRDEINSKQPLTKKNR